MCACACDCGFGSGICTLEVFSATVLSGGIHKVFASEESKYGETGKEVERVVV